MDAQNLGNSGDSNFRRQIELYETADVKAALGALGPLKGKVVLDVGGGLALGAILMARRGATVVISDISLNRLREAKRLVELMGLDQRIRFVVSKAEELPLVTESMDRVFTKSVLIHTDLPRAAAECARVLAIGGRAAFIEPQKKNPLVNLYRRLLAPKAWADITTYFGSREWRVVAEAFAGSTVSLQPFFFLGFLASAFSFALPSPRLYRVMERTLMAVDQILFRLLQGTKKQAWFGLLLAKK